MFTCHIFCSIIGFVLQCEPATNANTYFRINHDSPPNCLRTNRAEHCNLKSVGEAKRADFFFTYPVLFLDGAKVCSLGFSHNFGFHRLSKANEEKSIETMQASVRTNTYEEDVLYEGPPRFMHQAYTIGLNDADDDIQESKLSTDDEYGYEDYDSYDTYSEDDDDDIHHRRDIVIDWSNHTGDANSLDSSFLSSACSSATSCCHHYYNNDDFMDSEMDILQSIMMQGQMKYKNSIVRKSSPSCNIESPTTVMLTSPLSWKPKHMLKNDTTSTTTFSPHRFSHSQYITPKLPKGADIETLPKSLLRRISSSESVGYENIINSGRASPANTTDNGNPTKTAPSPPPHTYLHTILRRYQNGLDEEEDLFDVSSTASFFKVMTQDNIDAYTKNKLDAIRVDDPSVLQRCYHNGEILQCCNQFGESILHLACRSQAIECLKYLVSTGIKGPMLSLRVKDDYGRTPLHDACWTHSPNFDVIKLVIEKCPQLLLIPDHRGYYPLQYLPKQNDDECHWVEMNKFLDQHAYLFVPTLLGDIDENDSFSYTSPSTVRRAMATDATNIGSTRRGSFKKEIATLATSRMTKLIANLTKKKKDRRANISS